jgi:hypothetical protein
MRSWDYNPHNRSHAKLESVRLQLARWTFPSGHMDVDREKQHSLMAYLKMSTLVHAKAKEVGS